MKSFFEKLWADAKAMWKKAPAIEVAAASAINTLVPVIEEFDEIVDPALAVIVNPILDKVKVGLTAIKTTIQQAGTNANLPAIVDSVNSNMASLLSAVQVKDTALATKVEAASNVVKAELGTVMAVFAIAPAPTNIVPGTAQ